MLRLFNIFTISFFILSSVTAGTREQAYRLHNRISGVPPTDNILNQMQDLVNNSNSIQAAKLAMHNPNFYNLVLKNWVKTWTNTEQVNRVDFNDYVATVIGIIRDDIPFDQVLYGDILYTGMNNGSLNNAYSSSNNDHYKEMEDKLIDLKSNLERKIQSQMNNITDTAGVLTTRASGLAFYSAGTNRRVTRFTFINFLCRDFEAVHDTSIPDIHVRRDVSRDPGGDSRTFKNSCVGCHAGQDALAGAWAYFDFIDGSLIHTPGTVVSKINLNVLFSEGNQVSNDSWSNLWNVGQNSILGWQGASIGNGARSLGRYLSRSNAFSQCMAERSFELVCLKKPLQQSDKDAVKSLAANFSSNQSYNMKDLLARTSVLCLGE